MPRAKAPPKASRARKPAPKPPKGRADVTNVAPPNPNWGRELCWRRESAGVRVDEFTVMQVSAAWACINYFSSAVGQVDYNVYEALDSGGKAYRPEDPVDWILDRQPNPETTPVVFWEWMVATAGLWGNSYAEIQVDGYGRPQWLWQITPDRVTPRRDDDTGERVYAVANGAAAPSVIPASRMFHLVGPSWDAQVGYNVARLCRGIFGVALAAQEFASAFFQNDTTPGGVLTTDQALTQTAVDRILATWPQRHGGPNRAFVMAVLEQGLKFQPIATDAEKSQLNATQEFAVEQVARVFGVPPSKIGHMRHSGSRANLEEEDREAYKRCLRPWARRIECEADVKLFGRQRRGRMFTLHDFTPLLRGNTADLTQHVSMLFDRGIYSINEGRDAFDLNPLGPGEGGNVRLVPMNFVPLDRAGEQIAPGGKPGGAASGDSPGAGRNNRPPGVSPTTDRAREPLGPAQPAAGPAHPPQAPARPGVWPAHLAAAFEELFADAYGRLLRVEADKARRAQTKGELARFRADYYTREGEARVAELVRPVVSAFLAAAGRPAGDAANFAENFAADHNARSERDLAAGDWAGEWGGGRAAEQARAHVAELCELLPAPAPQLVVNVAPPGVRVENYVEAPRAPDVRVENHPPAVSVAPPDVRVDNHFAPPEVKVDNHVAAPEVKVDNHFAPPDVRVENNIELPAPGRKTARKRPDGSWEISDGGA